MKKAIGLAGIAVLMCSASVMAQHTPPAQQRGTMSQALESVGGNAAEHPDNRGLANAFRRLTENAAKHQAHQDEKGPKAAVERVQGTDRADRAEHAERADRPDRAERPDRPERVERPERPERPERLVRADRPEPPGRAKK